MDDRHITGAIIRRYLGRVLVLTTLWGAFILLCAFLGFVTVAQFTWYDYDPLYWVLSAVRDNLVLIIVVLLLGGLVLILALQWRRVAKSILAMTATVEAMNRNEDAEIALPEDLREIQTILQCVQAENLQNRRLAAEAEQRKNDLVVYLAHDLKTPLTSVLGYLTLLRDEADISPELRQKYLNIAVDKAARLEDLINEFFEITRFSLKGLTLEPGVLDLGRMLEQLVSEFDPLLAPKRLRCMLELAPELVLSADAGKLERVFDNLLRNAVNYSRPDSEITLWAGHVDGFLQVVLRNRGDTIPPHKLAHIFEQFYRVSAARASKDGGSGLGLAIAREIVELHHGSISVQSESDIIQFTVALPLGQVAALPARPDATAELPVPASVPPP